MSAVALALQLVGGCYSTVPPRRTLVASAGTVPVLPPGERPVVCPNAARDTKVDLVNVPEGIVMVLTTDRGDVEQLRRDATNLAAQHNDRYISEAGEQNIPVLTGPTRLAGGGYGARGGQGIYWVRVHRRPEFQAAVEQVEGGAKIRFISCRPEGIERLRASISREASEMWAGRCPSVG